MNVPKMNADKYHLVHSLQRIVVKTQQEIRNDPLVVEGYLWQKAEMELKIGKFVNTRILKVHPIHTRCPDGGMYRWARFLP